MRLPCVALQSAWAVTIDTVPVGNPGNAADTQVMDDTTTGYGSVAYNYRIGTTEVTNAQYTAFLNAKSASNGLGLYNPDMGGVFGGITQTGSPGSYSYATKTNMGNKPVNFVNWYDAIRFANWLHNGQGTGTTETGAYTLTSSPITRNTGATWFLPSENEWYKAAYHKNDGATGNYFDYPTSSDTAPTAEVSPGGNNSANFSSVVPGLPGLTNVGAYSASDSPYGTFDQGGNVWEWHEPWIAGVTWGLRGGAYDGDGGLAAWQRHSEDLAFQYQTIGFRVASVPEPSTAVLAIFGCAWMWALRKRFK